MSGFLANFAIKLAGVGQDDPPSRAWDELLPLLCDAIAGGRRYAAGLWISDDKSGMRHTLWLAHNSETNAEHQPTCVSVVAASERADDLHKAIAGAERDWVDPAHPGDSAVTVYPLVYRPKATAKNSDPKPCTLGVISLSFGQTARILQTEPTQDIQSAIDMAASWLRLNRKARIMHALTDMQIRRQGVGNTAELANMICAILADHANARAMCAVYVPDGARLVRLSNAGPEQDDWKNVPVLAHEENSPLSNFHFGIGPGSADNDIALNRYSELGALKSSATSLDSATMEMLFGTGHAALKSSVLIVRIRDRKIGEHSRPATIATLILVCRPETNKYGESIGGTFTETHLSVVNHAMDYVRNSYSLLLQREKMRVIGEAAVEIAQNVPDVMDETTDKVHFVKFAELARSTIPSAIDSVIVEVRKNPEQVVYHQANGKTTLRPAWLPDTPKSTGEFLSPDSEDRYCSVFKFIADKMSDREHFLVLLGAQPTRSLVEKHLIEQIIAETRAELHRHLTRPQWEMQLGEVRHNLRSVVTSVIGKATKIVEAYQGVAKDGSEAVYERLITRAAFHKSISDLEYTSNELLALTENIRTIAGSGGRIVPQISGINVPKMITECISLFKEELSRRGLTCNFDNQFPDKSKTMTGDHHWLHIMIFNLIENAVKYSRRNMHIHIRLWEEGQFWRLELINEGKHIPENMKVRIFDAYTRIAAEPGEQHMPGTGLGLKSVKSIVGMHQMAGLRPPGGEAIKVSSEIDKSRSTPDLTHARTIFLISIPMNVGGNQ